MDSVGENIRKFQALIPPGVEMVAVSKFHPVEMIREAYAAGQRCFGESRVQELLEKVPQLPSDIKWHFIGHVQTNKVKQLIGKTTLIESVDSPRLLALINKESEKVGIVTDILLQVHVADEETKFGFYPDELIDFLHSEDLKGMKNVRIRGIMGMATNTDNEEKIRNDFKKIAEIYQKIQQDSSIKLPAFQHLSMGMSGDWPIAVEEGANIVRIGSAIFGERNYNT